MDRTCWGCLEMDRYTRPYTIDPALWGPFVDTVNPIDIGLFPIPTGFFDHFHSLTFSAPDPARTLFPSVTAAVL
jgi:hypothetical protein